MSSPESESNVEPAAETERTGSVTADASAIDVSALELIYSDGTAAVQGVDLTVPEGKFFRFLGPNGAGKTTTIKVFATLLSPTDGEFGSTVSTRVRTPAKSGNRSATWPKRRASIRNSPPRRTSGSPVRPTECRERIAPSELPNYSISSISPTWRTSGPRSSRAA